MTKKQEQKQQKKKHLRNEKTKQMKNFIINHNNMQQIRFP